MDQKTCEPAIQELLEIDALADQFESSWRSGEEPRIEEWLAKATPVIHPALLKELLAVEVEFRVRRNETLVIESYLKRFPNGESLVAEALAPWGEVPSTDSKSLTPIGDVPDQRLFKISDERKPRAVPVNAKESDATQSGNQSSVGKFHLDECLGRGGFASVFRAYDTVLGRWVALKIPHGEIDSELRKRFVNEARAAAKLRHRNVVTVYESGTSDGVEYIACELVDGQDLANRVKTEPPALRQFITWILDAASGLAHAHQEGVIHRDIKPGNLLVGGDGRLLVSDFGMARRVDDQSSLTIDGTIFGTPAYMSPEQAGGRIGKIGAKSDQYSLGVVLYEFLAGRPPFLGSIPQVLQQILHSDVPTPRSFRPKVPADLEAVCLKAMAYDPRDRYPDMTALAEDLQRWLDGESVTARPQSWPQRVWRKAQRSPRTATAIGLASGSLVLTLFATWWATRQGAVAETAEQRAASASSRALAAESSAESNVRIIEDQQAKLTTAQSKVQVAITEADRNRYRASVRQVAEMIRDGRAEPSAIRAQLETAPASLRGWEWSHFHRIVQKPARVLSTSTAGFCSAALNSQQQQIALLDRSGKIQVVDLATASVVRSWETQAPAAIQMDWHAATQRIVVGGKVTGLRVWNSMTGKVESAYIDFSQVFQGIFPANSPKAPRGAVSAGPIGAQPEKEKGAAASKPQQNTTHSPPTTKAFFGEDGVPKVAPQGHWQSQSILAGSSMGWSAAFDPTGLLAAVGMSSAMGGGFQQVQIWELQTGKLLFTHRLDADFNPRIFGPGRGVETASRNKFATIPALSFSPDGTRLAAGTTSGKLLVWNTSDGAVRRKASFPHPVTALTWSPNGDELFVSNGDGKVVCKWLASPVKSTLNQSFQLSAHRGGATALAISSNAVLLATGGEDGFIRLWHLPTRRLVDEFYAHASPPLWMKFTTGGRQLISCSPKEVVLWAPRLPTSDSQSLFSEESASDAGGAIHEYAISNDARRIVMRETFGFSRPDQLVVCTSPTSTDKSTRRLLDFNANFSLVDLQFAPGDRWLAAATNGLVRVWDAKSWQPIHWRVPAADLKRLSPRSENIPIDGRTSDRIWGTGTCLAFDEMGSLFAFGEQGGHVGIVSTSDWTLKKLFHFNEKFQDAPKVSAFCPGKKLLAVGWSRSGTVRLIESEKDFRVRELNTHGPAAEATARSGLIGLAFSPDGELLATATADGAIRLWKVETGNMVNELHGHTRPATQLLFHPREKRLFSTGSDQTLRVWDTDSGLELVTLYSGLPRDSLGKMAMNREGNRITVLINKQIHSFSSEPPPQNDEGHHHPPSRANKGT